MSSRSKSDKDRLLVVDSPEDGGKRTAIYRGVMVTIFMSSKHEIHLSTKDLIALFHVRII